MGVRYSIRSRVEPSRVAKTSLAFSSRLIIRRRHKKISILMIRSRLSLVGRRRVCESKEELGRCKRGWGSFPRSNSGHHPTSPPFSTYPQATPNFDLSAHQQGSTSQPYSCDILQPRQSVSAPASRPRAPLFLDCAAAWNLSPPRKYSIAQKL